MTPTAGRDHYWSRPAYSRAPREQRATSTEVSARPTTLDPVPQRSIESRPPRTRAELIAWQMADILGASGWPADTMLYEILDEEPEDALKPASLDEGLDIELLDGATAPDLWHLLWGRKLSHRASGAILVWTELSASAAGDAIVEHLVTTWLRDGDAATVSICGGDRAPIDVGRLPEGIRELLLAVLVR